jgi:two-component system LytT family response regulator
VAMTTRAIRALVVDDEAGARQNLARLLKAHDDVAIVAECADGADAVDTLRAMPVDLVFLDVQMPVLDGFGVIATVGADDMPPVIFTSAYSDFAVRAFEAYAIDYLLKPFDATRLSKALDRAREQVALRRAPANDAEDQRLAGLLAHVATPGAERYPDAIAIKGGASYIVTPIADIDWIEADGNYARIHVQKRARLLTKSLATLEKDVLDPGIFVRVHRSSIVNAKKIAAVEPEVHGDLTLVLHDGTHVQCSRRYRKQLEEKLYFTT